MIGVLLINLGSPAAPKTRAVRKYLRQFLSDPYVIDCSPWLRWPLVHLIIAPFRAPRSAAAYRKIWTEEGSPLRFNSYALSAAVTEQLGDEYAVDLGMRYGKPSIPVALKRLVTQGITQLRILPLYPQYALSSTETGIQCVKKWVKKEAPGLPVSIVPPFYEDAGFIESFAVHGRDIVRRKRPDHILFSFHGLPESHIKRLDPSGALCLKKNDCCQREVPENQHCYRHHCFMTVRALAASLGLAPEQYSVSFQSRLGRTPWIKPYTDHVLPELAAKGVKRLAVFSPSFVADCLETLEEIGLRGRDLFLDAGGQSFDLVPCPNADPAWVEAVCRMVKD